MKFTEKKIGNALYMEQKIIVDTGNAPIVMD